MMHHLVTTGDRVLDHHELTLSTHSEYRTAFAGAGLVVETVESPMEARDRYVGVLPA